MGTIQDNRTAEELSPDVSDEDNDGSESDAASETDRSDVSTIDEETHARSDRLAEALLSGDEQAMRPLDGICEGGSHDRPNPTNWDANRFLPRGSAQFQDQHWYRALHIGEIIAAENLTALASASLPKDEVEEKLLDGVQTECMAYLIDLRDWAKPLPFNVCQVLTPEDSQTNKPSARFPLAVQDETIDKYALTLARYLLLLRHLLGRRDQVDAAVGVADENRSVLDYALEPLEEALDKRDARWALSTTLQLFHPRRRYRNEEEEKAARKRTARALDELLDVSVQLRAATSKKWCGPLYLFAITLVFELDPGKAPGGNQDAAEDEEGEATAERQGRLANPTFCSPKLASFMWMVRMTAFGHLRSCFQPGPEPVAIRSDTINELSAGLSTYAAEHLLTRGPSLASEVGRWLQYASKARGTDVASMLFTYDAYGVQTSKGITLTFDELKALAQYSLTRASETFRDLARLGTNWLSPDWTQQVPEWLRDMLDCEETGYSFACDEENARKMRAARGTNEDVALLQQGRFASLKDAAQYVAVCEGVKSITDAVKLYTRLLDLEEAFLRAMLLAIYLTAGAPPRATELVRLMCCNTPTGRRGVYLDRSSAVFIVLHSHKTANTTSGGTNWQSTRFLPARLGELLRTYLLLMRPTTEYIRCLLHGETMEEYATPGYRAERAVLPFLFVNAKGERLDSTVVTDEYQRAWKKAVAGGAMTHRQVGVRFHRQVAVAAAKAARLREAGSLAFLRGPADAGTDTGDGEAEDQEEAEMEAALLPLMLRAGRPTVGASQWAAQLGHSTRTHMLRYVERWRWKRN